jgi:nucleoside-diphosphate-sugar epimerase
MAAAGVNKHIDLEEAINANVLKPHKLLINAINSKCFNWIIIGSASEYGKQAKLKKPFNNKTKELPETNYEVTKNLFTKLSIFLSRKYKINCRIMRLFNVYGEGEKQRRLWQSLKTAAKLNKDFKMSDGKEIRDFISVNEVAKVILNAMNFKIKNKSFPQIWHVASGKPISVKSFAIKNWKKYKAKGRILFGKIKIKSKKNYISDKKSIWNIK